MWRAPRAYIPRRPATHRVTLLHQFRRTYAGQKPTSSAIAMKLLFDFFPVLLFFVAFKFQGIYVATAVAIAATIAQIIWTKYRHGKVDRSEERRIGKECRS